MTVPNSLARSIYALTALVLIIAACGRRESENATRFAVDDSLAYGLTAPGMVPELFAFHVLGNDAAQLAVAMSPDHGEMFYSQLHRDESGISFELLRSEYGDGSWSSPAPAPFASEHGEIEAFFNTRGNRLYFFSRRPLPGAQERPSPWNLWYVETAAGQWSEPRLLGQPDSLVVFNWSATLLDDTTLYFTARPYDDSGLAELYEVSIAGDVFGEPRSLGSGVNTPEYTENEPTMAPDGSYMVFYSAGRPDNLSSEILGDLYISFRGDDGAWREAVRLDEPINSTFEENWPRISPDGKFLFFSSDRREGVNMPDLYWVSTKALEQYRPH